MTPNQSKSFSSTDRTERKVGPMLAFSLSYLDEVLEGESLEVQRHWSRVQAAASASAINAELLEAANRAETVMHQVVVDIEATAQLMEWHDSMASVLEALRAALKKATA